MLLPEDAKNAVKICKYPPHGCRSMTGQLPIFRLRPMPIPTVIEESNAHASTVVLMIETKDSIDNVNEIAAVEDADVLLIGSNDLSIELGVPGDFKSQPFRDALTAVSQACKKYGKTMGLAGIYDWPDLQAWAIDELGVRVILAQQDSGLLVGGGKKCVQALKKLRH